MPSDDFKRTIVDLLDKETGEYIDANILLDTTREDLKIYTREALEHALRSNSHKYICALCNQPLVLRKRLGTWFFAHAPNTEECPVKSNTDNDPKKWAELWQERFSKSSLSKELIRRMKSIMDKSDSFNDVQARPCIENADGEKRFPSLSAKYGHEQIAIDFQLYSTFLSTIVERNAFYRELGTRLIWVFPYFSTVNQKVCASDTYYSHKRNVFVFDSPDYYVKEGDDQDKPTLSVSTDGYQYAQTESKRQGRLMLNCYWEYPVVKGDTIETIWNHRLISFDDLKFDEKDNSVYYIDSEKLFYEKSTAEERAIYDKWKKVKETRWKDICHKIEKRRYSESDWDEIEKRKQISELIQKVIDGEQNIIKYQDQQTRKWGYKVGNTTVIEPTFVSAKEFNGKAAPVKRGITGHWGGIGLNGKKTIDFKYDRLESIAPNLFVFKRDLGLGCIDSAGNELFIGVYSSIRMQGNKVVRADGIFESSYFLLDKNQFLKADSLSETSDGNFIISLDGRYGIADSDGSMVVANKYDQIQEIEDGYVVRIGDHTETMDRKFAFKENKWGIVPGVTAKAFFGKISLLNDDGDRISDLFFDDAHVDEVGQIVVRKDGIEAVISTDGAIQPSSIEHLFDGMSTRVILGKCGLFDVVGNQILPCTYDKIEEWDHMAVKVHQNGKCALYNRRGELIFPFKYNDLHRTWIGANVIAETDAGYAMLSDSLSEISSLRYEQITPFGTDLFAIKENGSYQLYDKDLVPVSDVSYIRIGVLINNQADYSSVDGRYGKIDTTGKELTSCRRLTNAISAFAHGGYWELHDNIGKRLTFGEYSEISSWQDNVFTVRKDGLYFLIDEHGNKLTDKSYKEIRRGILSNHTIVRIDGSAGTLCKLGSKFYDSSPLGNMYYSVHQDSGYDLYYSSGARLTYCNFEEIIPWSEGYFMVQKDNLVNLINYSGSYLLDCWYLEIGSFDPRQIHITRIDGTEGSLIKFGSKWIDGGYLGENCLSIYTGNGYKLVNFDNQHITEEIFDSITSFSGSLLKVGKDGHYYLTDKHGERISENAYDSIDPYSGYKTKVTRDGLVGYINTEGKEIPEIRTELDNGSVVLTRMFMKWGGTFANRSIPNEYDALCSYYGYMVGIKNGSVFEFKDITCRKRLTLKGLSNISKIQGGGLHGEVFGVAWSISANILAQNRLSEDMIINEPEKFRYFIGKIVYDKRHRPTLLLKVEIDYKRMLGNHR